MDRSGLAELLAQLASGDDARSEAAANQLVSLGVAALPALRQLLASPDPDQRWWSARALAEMPAEQAVPLLLEALQDSDSSVQQCAALALRQQASPQAVPQLTALLNDADRLLAYLAANALIATGKPAVPALLEIMQNGSQTARLEAVRALAAIGDTRAIPTLYTALDEDSALMEYWAEEGLERMGVGMLFFKP